VLTASSADLQAESARVEAVTIEFEWRAAFDTIEEHLRPLYIAACGITPTPARVIALHRGGR
jgi:hypothetical protein